MDQFLSIWHVTRNKKSWLKISNWMFKMSLLNVSNLTFDSGSCVSATGCTLDGFQEDIESCLPQVVKNYKVLAIINIVMIIIIGGFGNLFTIVAICVARVRYYFFSIRFIQWWLLILGSVLNLESCKYVKNVVFLDIEYFFQAQDQVWTFVEQHYHIDAKSLTLRSPLLCSRSSCVHLYLSQWISPWIRSFL